MSDCKQNKRFAWSIVLSVLAAACMLPIANAQTSSPRDNLVVTAEWLKQHANDKDLVLLFAGEKGEY